MTVRTTTYELTAGATKQIKITDNTAPIRFELVSGTFTYDHMAGPVAITSGTAVASGVVTAPGGAWGSEVRINCTADGVLHVIHIG